MTPRTSSSPWIRRYPQVLFSEARRRTSRRIDRIVRGRPARWGRELLACRRAIRSRCQRSTVSGRTSSRSWLRTVRGSGCSRAASQARSAGVNRTRSPCRCRSSTMIWCRSARISASLSRSLIGSSRSRVRVLVTPRYASRNNTPHRRPALDVEHRHDPAEKIRVGPSIPAPVIKMAVTRVDEILGIHTSATLPSRTHAFIGPNTDALPESRATAPCSRKLVRATPDTEDAPKATCDQ